MNKNEEYVQPIYKVDARNCFVEVKGDFFDRGKVNFFSATYDTKRPVGERQTNKVNAFIDIADILVLAEQAASGELAYRREEAIKKKEYIFQSMGGTSAKKMKDPRADGMSLSRIITIMPAEKGYFFSAVSGPGEENKTGLIVPRFKEKKPENKISVVMTVHELRKMLTIIRVHYQAWLASQYLMIEASPANANEVV